MTRGVENTLLTHGGTEDIDIPLPALQQIVNDAMTGRHTCHSCIALEEANQALARRVVSLSNEVRDLRDRLDGREFD